MSWEDVFGRRKPTNQISMKSLLTLTHIAAAMLTTTVSASPVMFTLEFPGGFDVSINGGPLTASGPITVKGIVDTTTIDLDPGTHYSEFPLISATFTGAGFENRTVTTPLSLTTWDAFYPYQMFAFELRGQPNQGIIGWNGVTASGDFMANINDLSTLVALPYTTSGTSTFWYDALDEKAWTLALGGDTIGANLGYGGPDGTFSISLVPEPTSLALAGLGAAALMVFRQRK